MTILLAESVHKAYEMEKGTVQVLCGASLEVIEGETVAILGKSGAGKSTLLHILGALDRPEQGHVVFRGKDLYRLSASRRTLLRNQRIGFVFQSYHLLPEMDVLENVMIPAMAGGGRMAATAIRGRARELLDAVGLTDRAGHLPAELSGGEQQRVALARSLMNNPELILADEPTGNLDDQTGSQVLEHLFSLTRERQHTLVMVTHNEQVAARCDRRYRLENGQVAPVA